MAQTTTTTAPEFRNCDARELLAQIGIRNILAISGGRVERRATGVTLPVRYGYRVTVDLDWDDTYIVRRVFVRGGKATVKREWTNIYCDEVGETAYQASCYLDA